MHNGHCWMSSIFKANLHAVSLCSLLLLEEYDGRRIINVSSLHRSISTELVGPLRASHLALPPPFPGDINEVSRLLSIWLLGMLYCTGSTLFPGGWESLFRCLYLGPWSRISFTIGNSKSRPIPFQMTGSQLLITFCLVAVARLDSWRENIFFLP